MDSFEWNKIAGGVLGSLLFMMVIGVVSGSVFKVHKPEKPGYVIEAPVESAGGVVAVVQTVDVGTALAAGTAAKGAEVFKKCATCHNAEKGGPNKTGPNLWGIVGNKHAHLGDAFGYSDGMKAKAAEAWSFDALYAYLENPKAAVPGNKMAFAGLSKPEDRGAVLQYLNSQSDSPLSLPKPAPAPAPAAAKLTAATVPAKKA